MPAEENKATVRETFDRIFNRKDLAAVDETFASNFVGHDSSRPEPLEGVDEARTNFEQIFSAFPDLNAAIEDIIAEDDTVAFRWTMEGTHEGELAQMGIPATGRSVRLTGHNMAYFRDGQFVEEWVNWDTLGLLTQLGVVPEPSQQAG